MDYAEIVDVPTATRLVDFDPPWLGSGLRGSDGVVLIWDHSGI
jgi:hypothetical protein